MSTVNELSMAKEAMILMGAKAYLSTYRGEPTKALMDILDVQFLDLKSKVDDFSKSDGMMNAWQMSAYTSCNVFTYSEALEALGRKLGVEIDMDLLSESKFVQACQ